MLVFASLMKVLCRKSARSAEDRSSRPSPTSPPRRFFLHHSGGERTTATMMLQWSLIITAVVAAVVVTQVDAFLIDTPSHNVVVTTTPISASPSGYGRRNSDCHFGRAAMTTTSNQIGSTPKTQLPLLLPSSSLVSMEGSHVRSYCRPRDGLLRYVSLRFYM